MSILTKDEKDEKEEKATRRDTKGKSGKAVAGADEPIVLELGATTSLSAADAIADPNNDIEAGAPAKWTTTNACAVITTEDHTGDTVEVVGSSVGRTRVSYAQKVDISADDAIAAAFAGAKYTDDVHDRHSVYFDVDVVPVGAAHEQLKKAAFMSSQKFDGLLPLNEVQEGPSEKTPYGMDQENKPVAPFPGMVSPFDDSSVARASEDAVANSSPEGIAKARDEAKKDGKDEKNDKDKRDNKR